MIYRSRVIRKRKTKMDNIDFVDESGDREHFTIIPNYIANHSSAVDQALYFQMKNTPVKEVNVLQVIKH